MQSSTFHVSCPPVSKRLCAKAMNLKRNSLKKVLLSRPPQKQLLEGRQTHGFQGAILVRFCFSVRFVPPPSDLPRKLSKMTREGPTSKNAGRLWHILQIRVETGTHQILSKQSCGTSCKVVEGRAKSRQIAFLQGTFPSPFSGVPSARALRTPLPRTCVSSNELLS